MLAKYFVSLVLGLLIAQTLWHILDSMWGTGDDSDMTLGSSLLIDPQSKASCRWSPTSMELLAKAETRILSRLKTAYKSEAVNIGPVVGPKDCQIWTISMNTESQGMPLVLLHGFGAGVAFWSLNFDTIAVNRPVYAIDHLGFGQSSRPQFATDPSETETQFVAAIEEWRQQMNLTKFNLLGHSFGGYLATSYALSHPERVAHLILADPWGFTPKAGLDRFPWWVRALAYVIQQFNPFAIVRAAGPWGQNLVERFRSDIINKFSELNENGDDVKFGEYVYHANAQTPSGEEAFKTMASDLIWSKFPMLPRVKDLAREIHVTFIYGSASWVERVPLHVFKQMRPRGAYTHVHVIQGSGHHVYSDGKDEFNRIVLKSCKMTDVIK